MRSSRTSRLVVGAGGLGLSALAFAACSLAYPVDGFEARDRDTGVGNDSAIVADTPGDIVIDSGAIPDGRPGGDTADALPLGVTALALGDEHACALRSDRTVVCWGNNALGQLGVDPAVTPEALRPIVVPGLKDVLAIAAGARHTCAIVAPNVAVCWGDNESGELGDGTQTTRFRPAPVLVPGPTVIDARALSIGNRHTCILDGADRVYCFGYNALGEVGRPVDKAIPTPSLVTLPPVSAVSAGFAHTCAVARGDNGIWCWGDNTDGELGRDPGKFGKGPYPDPGSATVLSPLDKTVGKLSAGTATCTLEIGALPRCIGAAETAHLPSANPELAPVGYLAAGVQAVCVGIPRMAPSRGGVWCWGKNTFGPVLGPKGTSGSSVAPLPIFDSAADTDVRGLALGLGYGCAIIGVSDVQCWGFNLFGQLGRGTKVDQPTPASVLW